MYYVHVHVLSSLDDKTNTNELNNYSNYMYMYMYIGISSRDHILADTTLHIIY